MIFCLNQPLLQSLLSVKTNEDFEERFQIEHQTGDQILNNTIDKV